MKEITGKNYYQNKEIKDISVFDNSLLKKGINVYEVLHFKNSVPVFFEDHFARLQNSACGKNLNFSTTIDEIREQIQDLIGKSNAEGNIKIVLHSEEEMLIDTYVYEVVFHSPSPADYLNGVKLISLIENRPDPNLKNWRPQFREMIRKLKKEKAVYEILLIDDQGNIREGSQSNFFAIFEHYILTSPAHKVLKGITRDMVFDICRDKNIILKEKDFNLSDLSSAQSVFISGTSPKILPVANIDNMHFNPSDSLLHILMDEYEDRVYQYIKNYQ